LLELSCDKQLFAFIGAVAHALNNPLIYGDYGRMFEEPKYMDCNYLPHKKMKEVQQSLKNWQNGCSDYFFCLL